MDEYIEIYNQVFYLFEWAYKDSCFLETMEILIMDLNVQTDNNLLFVLKHIIDVTKMDFVLAIAKIVDKNPKASSLYTLSRKFNSLGKCSDKIGVRIKNENKKALDLIVDYRNKMISHLDTNRELLGLLKMDDVRKVLSTCEKQFLNFVIKDCVKPFDDIYKNSIKAKIDYSAVLLIKKFMGKECNI